MKNLLFVILMSSFVSFYSCKQSVVSKELTSDNILARQISFPDKLLKLEGKKGVQIDSFLIETQDKTRIISIIDGSCVKCITNQLNYLDSLFRSVCNDKNIELVFILNVFQEDSSYFMRQTQSFISAQSVILWDNNYNFERENKLFTPDENLRTFMINEENEIVLYGNPIINADVINEYKKYMEH